VHKLHAEESRFKYKNILTGQRRVEHKDFIAFYGINSMIFEVKCYKLYNCTIIITINVLFEPDIKGLMFFYLYYIYVGKIYNSINNQLSILYVIILSYFEINLFLLIFLCSNSN